MVPNQQFASTLPHFQDGFVQNVHIPLVRVDPENRCAVMLIYGTKLVVLPFRKDTLTDEQELGVGEGYACSLEHALLARFATVQLLQRSC